MTGQNAIILSISALIPAIALLVYIYKKDRAEKEPFSLLLVLFLLGAAISIPVTFVESIIQGFTEGFMQSSLYYNEAGEIVAYSSLTSALVYKFIIAFVVAGLVEEGFKFLVLYSVTHKNKNFNSLFDGIIYSVFVSLGFAALENILYVFQGGLATAALRAVTSIPGHMFFSVIMGYNYTLWHIFSTSHSLETKLINERIIERNFCGFDRNAKSCLTKSLVMAVIAHGIYDFTCFTATLEGLTVISDICFYEFLIFLYVFCFKKIKSISKSDTGDYKLSIALILKKHPELQLYLNENLEFNGFYMMKRNAMYYSNFRPGINNTSPSPAAYAQPGFQPSQEAPQNSNSSYPTNI